MELTNIILGDIREAIGLSPEPSAFDKELLMHINSAVGKLYQNGVGNSIVVNDSTTWGDFQDPNQTNGNSYFHMVPLYVALSTKILFDPPPPSNVQYHSNNVDEILWRLKIAYEDTTGDDGYERN